MERQLCHNRIMLLIRTVGRGETLENARKLSVTRNGVIGSVRNGTDKEAAAVPLQVAVANTF